MKKEIIIYLISSLFIAPSYSQIYVDDIVSDISAINKIDNYGQQGLYISYDKQTRIVSFITNYRNGLKHGLFEFYQSRSGQLSNKYYYKLGLLDSVYRRYWIPNGIISMEINYKEGIPNGVATTYFEDGTLRTRVNYINGIMDKTYPLTYIEKGLIVDTVHSPLLWYNWDPKWDTTVSPWLYVGNRSIGIVYNIYYDNTLYKQQLL